MPGKGNLVHSIFIIVLTCFAKNCPHNSVSLANSAVNSSQGGVGIHGATICVPRTNLHARPRRCGCLVSEHGGWHHCGRCCCCCGCAGFDILSKPPLELSSLRSVRQSEPPFIVQATWLPAWSYLRQVPCNLDERFVVSRVCQYYPAVQTCSASSLVSICAGIILELQHTCVKFPCFQPSLVPDQVL